MATEYEDLEERRSRTWLWVLFLIILAFIAGLAVATYIVTHDPRVARLLKLETQAQADAEKQAAARIVTRVAPVPAATVAGGVDPATLTRVTTLEDKVDDIETQAREATGDASRAEGLLVAFAARRALDRGMGLGYIEGLLRQRFGDTQPQAVAMILSASRQPVTLADLENGLDAIAPTLAAGGNPKEGWWQSFRNELAGMVVVRKAGEPSTQPADRVARAQRMLEAGQVDSALAEIARLDDHDAAIKWIPAARRYIAGRGALDQIETAALLDPATSAGSPGRNMPPSIPASAPRTAPNMIKPPVG